LHRVYGSGPFDGLAHEPWRHGLQPVCVVSPDVPAGQRPSQSSCTLRQATVRSFSTTSRPPSGPATIRRLPGCRPHSTSGDANASEGFQDSDDQVTKHPTTWRARPRSRRWQERTPRRSAGVRLGHAPGDDNGQSRSPSVTHLERPSRPSHARAPPQRGRPSSCGAPLRGRVAALRRRPVQQSLSLASISGLTTDSPAARPMQAGGQLSGRSASLEAS
jgi:hypothetical protein